MGSWGWCGCLVFEDCFFSAKRPVEAKVDVSRFLGLCQALKYCNLQYFYVFGMEKDEKVFLLQRAEHCVNTSVLARHWPKNAVNTVTFATRGTKHRKYCGFVLPRRQKQWYLRCFMLGKCPKSVKTQSI